MERDQLVPCATRLKRLNTCWICEACQPLYLFNFCKTNKMVETCDCDGCVHEDCFKNFVLNLNQTQNINHHEQLTSYNSYTCQKCSGRTFYRADFQQESISFLELSGCNKFECLLLVMVVVLFLGGLGVCLWFAISEQYHFLLVPAGLSVIFLLICSFNLYSTFHSIYFRPKIEIQR